MVGMELTTGGRGRGRANGRDRAGGNSGADSGNGVNGGSRTDDGGTELVDREEKSISCGKEHGEEGAELAKR